jgi:hypothetical protein
VLEEVLEDFIEVIAVVEEDITEVLVVVVRQLQK